MRGLSKSEIISARYEKELKVRKSNLQNVRIEYAKEQEKLSDLRAEVVRSIQGESVYSKEMLAGLVNEVDAKVKELEAVLKEAEREVEEKESLIKELCDSYDEIMSWSELYDSASIEQKKMIVNAMITRIDVFNGYELNVEFNFNIQQFFEGIAEESEEESLIIQPKTA